MKRLKEKLNKNGGFTLVEMLIVVAIIAILIAVSIPLVNGALERARDATDQANERAAKAIATLYFMGATDDTITGTDATHSYTAGDEMGTTTPIYYDAKTGNLSFTYPAPYGQCTDKDTCYTNASIENDYNCPHANRAIRVGMTTQGEFSAHWVVKP